MAALRALKKSLMRHLFTYGPVAIDNVGANNDSPLRDTELGPLPAHWQVEKVGNAISRTIRVPKVQQSKYLKIGKVPVIDQGQRYIAGYVNDIEPFHPSIPVIVFGDHTRVVKYVDFAFVTGADGTKVLLPDTSKFEPLFLYFALCALELPSRGYNRHFALLREQLIPLPPLAEQREIARMLQA
ncbi:MAG: restriction endonuclease subunit S, partial [Anaerolineales bacterium]|nr:restriction endonuclease subunit S [Anaerolineales bacterium]MDW8163110.1 restriction endonuclease subunit S [Anaerolineales bacterium]